MSAVDRLVSNIVNRVRPQSGHGVGVSASVLAGWYLRKGALPALRGILRAPLLGTVRLPVFIGRGVVIEYGSRIFAGRSVQIGAGTRITAFSKHGVHLGDGVTIREQAWIQGSSHPSQPGEGLWVGASTYIGPRSTIGVGGPIRIGAGCQLGANVTLIAENHAVSDEGASAHEVVRRGIVLGDGCWLGHGVTITDGVELGPRCVVGAGAVVTRSYPEGSVLAGVPARPIRTS